MTLKDRIREASRIQAEMSTLSHRVPMIWMREIIPKEAPVRAKLKWAWMKFWRRNKSPKTPSIRCWMQRIPHEENRLSLWTRSKIPFYPRTTSRSLRTHNRKLQTIKARQTAAKIKIPSNLPFWTTCSSSPGKTKMAHLRELWILPAKTKSYRRCSLRN